MARVLILTLVFPPDGVSTAVIMGDLALDLKRTGHDVTVMTTVPHYNRDTGAEARQPLRRAWGPLLSRSEHGGVPVMHVAMPKKNASKLLRLLAWAQFHVLSVVATIALVRKVDVIVAPSPPLTIGVCAWLLGLVYRAPFIYNVQELYPDIAIRMGAIRHRPIMRALFALERFVYARAGAITVIADGMRQRVLEKGVAPEKVRLIPNFVDVDDMPRVPRDNAFSREHGLQPYFVVTYAGNMGPAQGLGAVLDAAVLLRGEPRLRFLFVGGGGEQDRLRSMARDRGIDNVQFLSHQPYARVPEIYAASDLCLVPLSGQAGFDAVPSKVYRIMACARPLLVQTIADSDLAVLVRAAQSGVIVAPEAPEALAAAVRELMCAPARCAAMGEAGRAHVLQHYGRTSVSGLYEALVREVSA
jgi:colanic acid biosynthesis glycosyl transferase WcaI